MEKEVQGQFCYNKEGGNERNVGVNGWSSVRFVVQTNGTVMKQNQQYCVCVCGLEDGNKW